ncbi:hypothetical protein CPAR01_12814 [Colletotrichum paranaense]|uniref:Arrestin-like N-terminal domain-containing protein n=1 Tax=Colletotrichum paranaense TaxID=1914294 RepID=A0ABQ9S7H9_9PEZI|nr:uncharacterized protein CPAR01_12814 [Colletotrichum paranaense]KAK1528256.1 hypothetical protein CPAR01_12814 [Colletotrichum paranaense]
MPPTERKNNLDLSIQLLHPETPLHGGSVILGHIVRKSHIVAANATVRVRLFGRAKAKLVVSRGNNQKSYYRSRFNFWPENAVGDVVHRGPVHVAPGAGSQPVSWPFALALPTHTDARAVNACGGESAKEACFLRPNVGGHAGLGLPEQPLPGTFHFDGSGFNKSWHGFVEYWVEAELAVHGKSTVVKAAMPVRVFSPPVPSPMISDFRLERRNKTGCVSSQRLLPGMTDAELSFKQKTQKFFGSSKVPTFHYTLDVQYPTVIQLGNEATIPFLLHLTPSRDRTSEIIEDVPQTVTIEQLELELQTTTGIICPGTLDPHDANKTRKLCLARLKHLFQAQDSTIVVPSGPKEVPLDLGAVLDLRVDALGRLLLGQRNGAGSFGQTVVPTFVTYCLKVEHVLHWEVKLSVAGESWKCEGSQKLLVLAPDEDTASGRTRASAVASSSIAPPPPVEEVPAYDGPSEAAPAYEKVVGGGEEAPAIGGKS